MPLKIGLLVPGSNFIPVFAKDYITAIKMGLGSIEYELYIESTSYNAERDSLEEKVQKLLINHQVDVVIAPLNVALVEHLKGFFNSNRVPLIVNTLGEDLIFDTAQDPYVFVNSFNLWQTAWMSGYWGAENYGGSACSIAAIHDGGYGMNFAFGLGLEAKDGQIKQTAVTHRESTTEDPSQQLEQLMTNDPDFIFGLYSGKEAISFFNAYKQGEYLTNIPLICLPTTVTEINRREIEDHSPEFKYISCWDMRSEAAIDFSEAIIKETGREVCGYSLLGYETGQMIAKAHERRDDKRSNGEDFGKALLEIEVDGPRGVIKFDPKIHEIQTKSYLVRVSSLNNGAIEQKTVTELKVPPLLFEQMELARQKLTKQGWLNPYLIA